MPQKILTILFSLSVALNIYLLKEQNYSPITQIFAGETLSLSSAHSTDNSPTLLANNKQLNVNESITLIDTEDAGRDANTEEQFSFENHFIKLKSALKNRQYDKASNFFHDILLNPITELKFNQLKTYWLSSVDSLISNKQITAAEESIQTYLSFKQDDVDFLTKHALVLWESNDQLSAIKHAYEIQYYVFDEQSNLQVIEQARTLVNNLAQQYVNKGLWQELVVLVEQVQSYDSEYLEIAWLLASAQYNLGEFDLAYQSIQPLIEQPNYKLNAIKLLEKIEFAQRQPETIQLAKEGQHYLVDVTFDALFDVTLMIDTGASISLLTEETFVSLSKRTKVKYLKEVELYTAGGAVNAGLYQVSEAAIGDYVVSDLIFAVSPYASDTNDGLLGMNFLQAFDFHIDQKNHVLTLKNK